MVGNHVDRKIYRQVDRRIIKVGKISDLQDTASFCFRIKYLDFRVVEGKE
jgi:hypothetical protein